MSRKRLLLISCAMLVLVTMLVGACATPKPTATPAPTVTATATTTVTASPAPAPTVTTTATTTVTASPPAPVTITATPKPTKFIKVGHSVYLTGAAAVSGIPVNRGLQLQVDELNERGGFWIGDQNYKWQLVVEDNAYNTDLSVKVANKLIYQDKVKYFIQNASVLGLAVAPVVQQAGDVFYLVFGDIWDYMNPKYPLTFMWNRIPPEKILTYLYKELVKVNPNVKSVASLMPDTDTGYIGGRGVKAGAEAAGITLLAQEFFNIETSDFYPVLTRLIAKKPDVIDLSYTQLSHQTQIIKQARELGYKGTFVLFSADSAKLVQAAGAAAVEGAYNWFTLAEPVTDYQKWFYNQNVTKYGEWNQIGIMSAPMPIMLQTAMEKAQSIEPKDVAKVLEDGMVFEGPYGPLKHVGKKTYGVNHVSQGPLPVAIVKGGVNKHAFFIPPPEDF
ncbi:MAG: ABC transporter substrate-binding protein [Chloroflexi bacterium]|nr:ABC transporter substrate-binding protein [Chloroflexota bacterium]